MAATFTWMQDLSAMYKHLQYKIESAQTVDDLRPFINTLFDQQAFKNRLLSLLEQEYQNESDKIRSLFIKTNQMHGIPSDDVTANIISYLSPRDLSEIPAVSKHFNRIMHQYPHIYNDNNYKLIVSPYGRDSNLWYIDIVHDLKAIFFSQCSSKEKYDQPLFQEIPKPFKQLKIWEISIDDNDHDVLNMLETNSKNIWSLKIEKMSMTSQNIRGEISKISFSNLKVLKVSNYIKCNGFNNLQSLSVTANTEDVMEFIQYLPESLYVLELDISNNRYNAIIKIPKNVEWLYLECYDCHNSVQFDLRECTQLIGIRINGEMIKDIVWPRTYVIPYSDIYTDFVERRTQNVYRKLIQQKCPIRIIKFERCYDLLCPMTFDAIKIKLNNFNEYEKLYDEKSRRMVMKDGVQFHRFIQMVIANETKRKEKIAKIEQLRKLKGAKWIMEMFDDACN